MEDIKEVVIEEQKISDEKIEELIENLRGTCKSFFEGCEMIEIKEDDLTSVQLTNIDEEIFCCEECGWWCDISDQRNNSEGDSVCSDCFEDDDEDDDEEE